MTRHGNNCTAGSVYTYHERKKDTKASGYGSQKIRLGKDSQKPFDCCSLTLQPCKNPVITPDGVLYDKEAILEYIIHQKREIARKLKEYEKQKTKLDKELATIAQAEEEAKVKAFIEREMSHINKPTASAAKASTSKAPESSLSNMSKANAKKLPSFWVPSMAPSAKPELVKKPEEKVKCPMSGKPLKLKDLIEVNFTAIKDRDKSTSLIAKEARYVCAVTNDILTNATSCAVLRSSGCVVTQECVDKIIREDMRDPINGKELKDKDIITLNVGATGFAGKNPETVASRPGPVLQA